MAARSLSWAACSRYPITLQDPCSGSFFVFTYTPSGYALLSEDGREATLAIAHHTAEMRTASLLADVDRDGSNNLIIATYPNLYATQWDGTALRASWHRKIEKTPTLFTAELNQNGFDEFYLNLEDGIYQFESVFAIDPDGTDRLTPWNVETKPLTEKAVQVTWNATEFQTDGNTQPSNLPTFQPFTVYRAQGGKEKAPADDMFEKIAENLTSTRFLDRRLTKNNTYWYAVTAKDANGTETPRTEPIAAHTEGSPAINSRRLSST